MVEHSPHCSCLAWVLSSPDNGVWELGALLDVSLCRGLSVLAMILILYSFGKAFDQWNFRPEMVPVDEVLENDFAPIVYGASERADGFFASQTVDGFL